MSRSAAVLAAVAIALVAGCTAPHTTAGPTPIPTDSLPSPDADRISLTCTHVAQHKVFRTLVSDEAREFLNNALRGEEHIFCSTSGDIEKPVAGTLIFELAVDTAQPQHDPPATGSPNLHHCYGTNQCWVGGADECVRGNGPEDAERRLFVASARSLPYDVEVRVGLLPDNRRDLCEADRWSRATSIELLNEALHYLATGS